MGFLFVDRILELSPGKLARGIKHITREDSYLCSDETGRFFFLPSLIGETLGQLAAWVVMMTNDFTLRPVAGVVSSAKLHRPAYVGETLLLESMIESLDDKAVQYNSIARVGSETVFSIEGALGPLLPMSDLIDEVFVRRQFNEINRPGDWSQISQLQSQVELKGLTPSQPIAAPMHFDRILDFKSGVSLLAEKRISLAAPYFSDHFPNKPVLPMTVLLESKLNLAHEFLARSNYSRSYRIDELRRIKMNEFVYPGDVLTCQLEVKQHDAQQLVLRYRSEVDGKRVCILELAMLAEGDSL